jgi:hypothetical protein
LKGWNGNEKRRTKIGWREEVLGAFKNSPSKDSAGKQLEAKE